MLAETRAMAGIWKEDVTSVMRTAELPWQFCLDRDKSSLVSDVEFWVTLGGR